ncbi:OLC1v1006612C1 [Oldenlandia corymbosa var. corymbosa]|uniref:OLC1v1006612C1 n=1 Tax=Oldenlandia corymbosa var. corymbosa TaxID=529605 RepID=A0AAV1DHF0_OLDCO|nr:OLC1v1006612C1 [Oldenlandia corymbosa var. corymbosa]
MFSGKIRKIPLSRRSIRTRFAYKFSKALKELNQKRTFSSSLEAYNRRCYMVKMASYASLASAAGSRRTWSRALLWKIRRNKGLMRTNKSAAPRRRISSLISKKEENPNNNGEDLLGLEGLRKLVPGGEVMDALSLFDETADYIKCLTIQVQIMRKFVHFYSG